MPITAGNFEKLAADGFYDGVISSGSSNGFMIQGGDHIGDGSRRSRLHHKRRVHRPEQKRPGDDIDG